jgi:hypothetical protein
MQRYERDGAEVWVGPLGKLGLVIFDPRAQLNVSPEAVRLFVWRERRMGLFTRKVARGRLTGESELHRVGNSERIAAAYLALRIRSTHCYACKRDLNSVSFSQCPSCQWIRCECRACGCSYRRCPEELG